MTIEERERMTDLLGDAFEAKGFDVEDVLIAECCLRVEKDGRVYHVYAMEIDLDGNEVENLGEDAGQDAGGN